MAQTGMCLMIDPGENGTDADEGNEADAKGYEGEMYKDGASHGDAGPR